MTQTTTMTLRRIPAKENRRPCPFIAKGMDHAIYDGRCSGCGVSYPVAA